MISEVKATLASFVACILWFGLTFFKIDIDAIFSTFSACVYFGLLAVAHVYLFYLILLKHFSISIRAYGIGGLFLLGLCIMRYLPSAWFALGIYVCVVALFHISEYLATAYFNYSSLDLKSFLINHSLAYNVAHLTCCVEYAIWCWFCPDIKLWRSVQLIGLCLCIFGEVFRKSAMRAAGVNFTHQIQYEKRREHVLVTSGIYSICRHPSYAGWFCWSVATQILLCNPVCFVGFCIVSWKFFDERIYEEEQILLNFFQTDYLKYQKKVPTGVPFVTGYRLKFSAD